MPQSSDLALRVRAGNRRRPDPLPSRHSRSGLPFVFGVWLMLAFTVCGERSTSDLAKKSPSKPAAPEISWPMTRGGPSLSGNVPTTLPRDPVIAWTFAASGPITAEASLVAGRVYVGTGKGTLHCLSADSGLQLWEFPTKDAITAAPAIAAVGTAEFFVFLMTERDAAIPAVSGDDVNKGFVNEFHVSILNNKAPASGALQGGG